MLQKSFGSIGDIIAGVIGGSLGGWISVNLLHFSNMTGSFKIQAKPVRFTRSRPVSHRHIQGRTNIDLVSQPVNQVGILCRADLSDPLLIQ
jgi:hypothetical protein